MLRLYESLYPTENWIGRKEIRLRTTRESATNRLASLRQSHVSARLFYCQTVAYVDRTSDMSNALHSPLFLSSVCVCVCAFVCVCVCVCIW